MQPAKKNHMLMSLGNIIPFFMKPRPIEQLLTLAVQNVAMWIDRLTSVINMEAHPKRECTHAVVAQHEV
jgi:hypothetical protein